MNTPRLALPPSVPIPSKLKNRRVLLVDPSASKRDLRAETMRKMGMEVDCAADISEARSWWRADLYKLVLIDMDAEMGLRDKFCEDVRGATPPQQLAFFVGKPAYLADAPNGDQAPEVRKPDQPQWGDVKAALAADIAGVIPQRWGILEASRRISAVRSLAHARSQAVRERPVPALDLETREFKPIAAETRSLDDLLREEMQ
jgi:CheY-like chemotaxis protein